MPAETKKEIGLEIAHVLFIDIVGYSKLLIDEQRDYLHTLNEIVRETDSFRAADAAGKLTRLPTGDGMALVFATTPDAPVSCALQISKALRSHPEVQVRMGIHSGPVSGITDVNDRSNVAGAGINLAQRVMDCGDAGHILLSKHVADDLEQYRQWRSHLHDLGECEVKHDVRVHVVNLYTDEVGNEAVPEKFRQAKTTQPPPAVPVFDSKPARRSWSWIAALIIVTALAAAAGFYIFSHRSTWIRSASAAIPEKSIAVLPFENLSRDPDNAYFADGIQDEILTRLSKIADLKVISRTSTQQYQSKPGNLPEIARQLGVAHILEGSVQKAGNAVHINVQLIKAATDAHLWGESYDRELQNIFGVEGEVAKAIADQLRAKLTGQEEQVIAAKPTDNPEAYDAYLRGLAYTLKTGANTPVNTLGAQKYLRDAVKLDPKFALAWALLSTTESRGYITLNLQPTVALREEARQAAETALTLQSNLGEALLAKGYYHYSCLKDYDTAVRYFEQARPLLPNSSQIPEALAYVTRRRGQWDRSEAYFNEAERLDPRNAYMLSQHAQSYLLLRRFPEAQRKLDQVLNITPDDVDTLVFKGVIAQCEGDLPRAAALLAPLHPNADDTSAFETQVYQAILERHPAPAISRLQEILAKPDPALGFYNGELRFFLGWAQEVGGEHAAAQETWRQARNELEPFLNEQPDNYALIGDLALISAALGDKAAALALTQKAIAASPLEKDALNGSGALEFLARVLAQAGEPDRALAAIEKMLSIPSGGSFTVGIPLTPALLRLDPMFDPLRNDPRFQRLAASEASK